MARSARQRVVIGAVALVVAATAVAVATTVTGGADDPTPAARPVSSPSSRPPSPTPSAARAPVPPLLPARTGAQLLVVQGTKLETLDVDTGARRMLPTDPRLRDHDRLDVRPVGSELAVLGDDQTGAGNGPYPAYLTTSGPGSALREVGQASYLLPSRRADRVWLVADEDTNGGDSGTTLVEVDVHGRVRERATFVHAFGVRPFAGAFLLPVAAADGGPGDHTDLVDRAGRRLHRYLGNPVATSGSTAVLVQGDAPCSSDCRLLVLTAGRTITERSVAFDALPGLMEPGLSRDATRLFTSAVDESDPTVPSRVTELDLTTGRSTPVTDAWSATYYGPSFQFTPEGRWMFFLDVDKVHVDAYDLQERTSYRVKGTYGTITQLTLLP